MQFLLLVTLPEKAVKRLPSGWSSAAIYRPPCPVTPAQKRTGHLPRARVPVRTASIPPHLPDFPLPPSLIHPDFNGARSGREEAASVTQTHPLPASAVRGYREKPFWNACCPAFIQFTAMQHHEHCSKSAGLHWKAVGPLGAGRGLVSSQPPDSPTDRSLMRPRQVGVTGTATDSRTNIF